METVFGILALIVGWICGLFTDLFNRVDKPATNGSVIFIVGLSVYYLGWYLNSSHQKQISHLHRLAI
jgi:hypothetical protein